MVNVKQPWSGMSDEQMRVLLQTYYDAIIELQRVAQAVTPTVLASAAGPVMLGYLASQTVTDPATGQTYTANVYITAVPT
jgi:hypothetical protein